MKRLLTLIGASSLVLAACGDDDDNNATETVAPAGAGQPTVTVVQVEGLGGVLADADGMVLYMNDQDTAESVVCVDACTEEWPPLDAGSSTPTGASGVTGLGTVDRPDGSSQVTFNGHPLYTFADDASAGEATGDGDADEFGGQQFTWHAAALNMTGATATTMPGGAGTQPSDTTAGAGTGY